MNKNPNQYGMKDIRYGRITEILSDSFCVIVTYYDENEVFAEMDNNNLNRNQLRNLQVGQLFELYFENDHNGEIKSVFKFFKGKPLTAEQKAEAIKLADELFGDE